MFQELQASGILLCYGPLALVILGFIGFAIRTDNIANRTYLRRLEPRPQIEHDEPPPYPPVPRPMRVLLPAGAVVTLLPEDAPLTTDVPVEPDPRKLAHVDDLSRLEGIGPRVNEVLHQANITTYSQIAAMTPEALRAVLDEVGLPTMLDTTTWPQQAALAAEGRWAELQALQDQLRSGRRTE